jgi:hypothetical protein
MTERLDLERLADARPVAAESLVGDVSLWNPPTSPRTPREALEAAISAAIDLLDSAEMRFFDLEDGGDLEPDADEEVSLGSPNESKSQVRWGDGTPANGWDADREGSEDDLEPSLGSIGSCYGQSIPQTMWARGSDNDAEGDEHDGAEPDQDGEPSHGSTSALNQNHAWRASSDFSGSGEGEPSFGWSDMPPGRGHPESAWNGYAEDREQDVTDQPHDDCEEGGGALPCLDQTVEIGGAAHELAREQAALAETATRLAAIVARVRAGGHHHG